MSDMKAQAQRAIDAEARRNGTGNAQSPNLLLRNLADVSPEQVEWLWYPYLPLGKLALLEGDPGVGKSYVSLAIATHVSLGMGLPRVPPTEPGPVLIASAEDGLGDTIRPRLDAMKANVTLITAIDSPFSLDEAGCQALGTHIAELRPKLLIIDPLVAYVGSFVDIHRSNEVRAVMARLAQLAERHRMAILAVRHLTKAPSARAIYRGAGSIDFTAACRSVLLAGQDPDDCQRRALVQIKNNLAPMGQAVGYECHGTGKTVQSRTGQNRPSGQALEA